VTSRYQARAQVAEIERFRREIAELEAAGAAARPPAVRKGDAHAVPGGSTAAEQVGLGVSLFQPRDARPKDVVSEIPIVVTAEGSYHQLAKFFEQRARCPRWSTSTTSR
jgi:Tfp pilus assembly protein PilO